MERECCFGYALLKRVREKEKWKGQCSSPIPRADKIGGKCLNRPPVSHIFFVNTERPDPPRDTSSDVSIPEHESTASKRASVRIGA
jgi:hypothetical protein